MNTLLKTITTIAAGLFMTTAVLAQGHTHSPYSGHLVFKNNTLHMHASFSTEPKVGAKSVMVLEAKDPATHQTIEFNENINVVLWMPSMGHGSAPTQVARATDANGNNIPGTFLVSNVYFMMGGDWEIRVTLTDAQGVQETQSFAIQLAGSGHGHH